MGNLATSVGEKGGTSAESCGPGHPESETSGRQAGYKRRIMRPKASTDKWDRQVQNYAAQSIHSVLRDSGGQVGDKGNKFRFRWPRPP